MQAEQAGVPVIQLTKSTFLFASPDVAAAVAAIEEVFGATVPALDKAGSLSCRYSTFWSESCIAVLIPSVETYWISTLTPKTP